MPLHVIYSWNHDAKYSYDALVCAGSLEQADDLMFILLNQHLQIKDKVSVSSTKIGLNDLPDQYKKLTESQLFLEQYSRNNHRRVQANAELLTIEYHLKASPLSSKIFNWLQNSIIPPGLCLAGGSIYSDKFRFGMMMMPLNITGAVIIKCLAYIYSAQPGEMLKKDADFEKRVNAVKPFYVSVIVPFKEELMFRVLAHSIFRHLVQYFLIRYASLLPVKSNSSQIAKWIAIVGSSILFGYAHKGNGNPVQVLYTTYMGLVLSMIYESKGFPASVGLHMAQNFLHPFLVKIGFNTNTQKRLFLPTKMYQYNITQSWVATGTRLREQEKIPVTLDKHFEKEVIDSQSNAYFRNTKRMEQFIV